MVKAVSKIFLEQILRNNPLQPLIVVGKCAFNDEYAVFIDADIDERELHIPTQWKEEIQAIDSSNSVYLVVQNLDTQSFDEQKKFVGLIKDRRAGNFKLGNNVHIVISISDLNKVAPELKKLSLLWEI
ncbi:MAG: hypothetical protein IJ532_00085 [Alphaproteobacteria bacterium]|nr:hypothetical protein [Alphaproteobacteria bacterium]